jgi:hypothetical protein
MNTWRILAVVAGVALVPSTVQAMTFDDAAGRWLCRPTDPLWPQILVDFEEDAYRRCDQNTCVSYVIAAFETGPDATTIRFGGDANLVVRRDGSAYFETLFVGDGTVHRRGACEHLEPGAVYDARPAPGRR